MKASRFTAVLLIAFAAVCAGREAYADDYTFTQPDDLSVSGAGWNATSGIHASAEQYVSSLVVTAS